MKVIDIHSHLQFLQFGDDRDDLIRELANQDMGTITVGTDRETSAQAADMAAAYDHIWATVGHHPGDWQSFESIDVYRNLIEKYDRIVAIGECGLDFYRSDRVAEISFQSDVFVKHVELAIETGLPLMIHGRPTPRSMDAYQDILDILNSFSGQLSDENPGNIHFFVGDTPIAKRFLELGFTLSFDGPITFARDYDEVIRYLPSDMVHAETDAPFAAPKPYRGRRNSPLYVSHVIDSLIAIRAERDPEKFKQQLVFNAKRVFKLGL